MMRYALHDVAKHLIGAEEEKSVADAIMGHVAQMPPEPRVKLKPK
jgi:hypothetical protein